MDFDPSVVAVSSQPFWLFWMSGNGKGLSHVPDYFARRNDGSAAVFDCRPVERRRPRDWEKFEAAQAACDQVGWEFRLVEAPDEVRVRNVRWLAGYRHPRHLVEPLASGLRKVFAAPRPLMDGATLAGDPIAVLPVLFHLLWLHELSVDVQVPLHAAAMVSPGVVQ